jgi:hypothetical protein
MDEVAKESQGGGLIAQFGRGRKIEFVKIDLETLLA